MDARRGRSPRDGASTIREAIAAVRTVAVDEADVARERAAAWLESLFDGVSNRREIRAAAREALSLYRGGMGSFVDVGTAPMSEAVEGLRIELRRAARLL